jgi:hypothetical protein
MTPQDLSRSGWLWDSSAPRRQGCVIGGRRHDASEISGILVRATHVDENDIGQITEGERRYVAAEMTAFLIHWMTQIGVPVLNRPGASCLGGPGWHPEHWAVMAGRVGLVARRVRRVVGGGDANATGSDAAPCAMTVVGERAFGAGSPALHRKAIALARLANVQLLRLGFDGAGEDARLLNADQFPLLDDPDVEAAVLTALARR